MAIKEAVVGGSVNLGNYESFKFEFRGEITSTEDYLDLATFAAGALLGQAAGADDATREQVRRYVGRVFGLPDELVPNVQKAPKAAPAPEPAAPAAPKEEATPGRYDTGFPAKPLPTRETKAWSGGDPRPLKAEEKPAPTPDKKPAVAVCEMCGGPVTKTQKQMSQLFLNKTLCQACLDKATGKGAKA